VQPSWSEGIQEMQRELDTVIQQGVLKITQLLKNTEKAYNIGTLFEEKDDDLLDTVLFLGYVVLLTTNILF
jgi:succinate dehydrogenase flavin-adding protein (antitoxin of CptAB toxin-antitoxin module)